MKRIQYNSPVILTFSLISLGALLLGILTDGWTTVSLFSVYRSSLGDPLFYVRLFGHMFGHADYGHFMGNILMLLVIGPPLEEKYGSLTLAGCIAITGFLCGLAQCIFFENTLLLGASGIVFMLVVLSSFAGMKEGKIPLTLLLVLVFYVGGELLDGLVSRDNTAHYTHILGGVCGAFLGYGIRRREQKKSRIELVEQPAEQEH
jgi:rhomboid protease GluP